MKERTGVRGPSCHRVAPRYHGAPAAVLRLRNLVQFNGRNNILIPFCLKGSPNLEKGSLLKKFPGSLTQLQLVTKLRQQSARESEHERAGDAS